MDITYCYLLSHKTVLLISCTNLPKAVTLVQKVLIGQTTSTILRLYPFKFHILQAEYSCLYTTLTNTVAGGLTVEPLVVVMVLVIGRPVLLLLAGQSSRRQVRVLDRDNICELF